MNLFVQLKSKKGFTLIELLVVIGILAVLLAITLIAINPARQFQQANDTKRRSDVSAILNAINQYMSDRSGAIPTGITTTSQNISNTLANLCALLAPTYIATLPSDPTTGSPVGSVPITCGTYDTDYEVVRSGANNRMTVCADSEQGVGGLPPAANDLCVTR